jgi:hypothetical protein
MTMYEWQDMQAKGKANIRWIKAYLECLVAKREVYVINEIWLEKIRGL